MKDTAISFVQRFIQRHVPQFKFSNAVYGGVASALVIAILGYFSELEYALMLMAPFGASCVLLFAMPAAPVSQPLNVIAGHVLAGAIGIAISMLLPNHFMGEGLAVGLSVFAMMVTRLVHPPAGATALVAYLANAGWGFLLFPIAAGSAFLVIVAALYYSFTTTDYPIKK